MIDQPYHDMLDDVAAYALGAMPPADAKRVRDHMASCQECRAEYAALAPAAAAIGFSVEPEAGAGPGPLLKARIMREVRREDSAAGTPKKAAAAPLWPAYLVAAACFAFALISSVYNMSLSGRLRDAETKLAATSTHSSSLEGDLTRERAAISQIMSTESKHYLANDGEVVTHGATVYVAMHDLPPPPRGKVYQAWTLPKGSKTMAPSVTFVPDVRGVAILELPAVDARNTTVVAVSVEPEGGSKQPTSKPVLVVSLT